MPPRGGESRIELRPVLLAGIASGLGLGSLERRSNLPLAKRRQLEIGFARGLTVLCRVNYEYRYPQPYSLSCRVVTSVCIREQFGHPASAHPRTRRKRAPDPVAVTHGEARGLFLD